MDLPFLFERDRLVEWCQRWKVRELSAFGSLLRADFGPSSDVDLLVTFEPNAAWSLLDHELMEQELTDILSHGGSGQSRRSRAERQPDPPSNDPRHGQAARCRRMMLSFSTC